MTINFHPDQGTIVICDFKGFVAPEMIKKRPALVISPRFRARGRLCTIVPFSTTAPNPVMPYHYKLKIEPVLPEPNDSPLQWVKADMVYTVSFDRLSFPFLGKDDSGKRIYDIRVVDVVDLQEIQRCVLNGLGLGALTV